MRAACTNCHQFLTGYRIQGSQQPLMFCSTDCAHEWSCKVLESATPAAMRKVLIIARQLTACEPAHRPTLVGKLYDAAREAWPTKAPPK